MLAYPLIYMLIWIIPTTIRIYQASTGKPAPFPIATVDKTCIVIQGFADAVIYGFNEASLSAWKGLILPWEAVAKYATLSKKIMTIIPYILVYGRS